MNKSFSTRNLNYSSQKSKRQLLPSIRQVRSRQVVHRSKILLLDQSRSLPKIVCHNSQVKNEKSKTINQLKRQRYTAILPHQAQQIYSQINQIQTEQKRRNISLNILRRQMQKQQMKQINKNYLSFIKQFKKTKPLYQIKKQEFLKSQQQYLQKKKQQALKRIRLFHKPLFNSSQMLENRKVVKYNKEMSKHRNNPEQLQQNKEDIKTTNDAQNKQFQLDKLKDKVSQKIQVISSLVLSPN